MSSSYGEIIWGNMPYRRLGKTNLKVSAIALGGFPLGQKEITDKQAIDTVHYALYQGVNFFDASPMYGECQRRMGLALENVPRDSIVISTKTGSHHERCGDYSWDATMWSVELSLKLLKTDYLDIVHIHDPDTHTPEGIEEAIAPGCALDALEHLKEQGIIKAIGLGQKSFYGHKVIIESGRVDVIMQFNNYHPLDTSLADWLLPLAAKYDVGVMNASVLAHGFLTGGDPDEVYAQKKLKHLEYLLPAARIFYKFCKEKHLSMISLILQFCLQEPRIHCIPIGVKLRETFRKSLIAAVDPLPESIWQELESLNLPSLTRKTMKESLRKRLMPYSSVENSLKREEKK